MGEVVNVINVRRGSLLMCNTRRQADSYHNRLTCKKWKEHHMWLYILYWAVPSLFGTRNQCSYENLIPHDLIPDLILWIPNAWGGAKAVMLVLGNSCKHRWSFASSPAAYLLLGPILVWAQGLRFPALLKSQLILIFSYTFICLGTWLTWPWSHSVWDLQ